MTDNLLTKPWPCDKPLYKYLKKEFAEQLFNTGTLRIGTLYEFRNQELHGDRRGDKNEGKKEIYEYIENTTIEDSSENNPLSPFTKEVIQINPEAKKNTIKNTTVYKKQNSQNLYIYCMSSVFNKNLFDEFQADVCVLIKNPCKFIRTITIALRKKAEFYSLSTCRYSDRKQSYKNNDNFHPALIKPLDVYKTQKEVRAIWTPKSSNENLEALNIILQKKHVRRFCEIYNYD